jgi:lipopolysaccharide export system permease protein
VAPGQFQESAKGRRVFFIDKDGSAGGEGRNVFISNIEPDGSENITSARGGRLETIDGAQFLVLERGQRLDLSPGPEGLKVTEFREFASQVGSVSPDVNFRSIRNTPTWELWRETTTAHMGELGWRLGVPWVAVNLVLVALAVSAGNARSGRSATLPLALLAFVFYNNLLNVGQAWVSRGMVGVLPHMLGLHGSIMLLSLAWIAKRHRQWVWRDLWSRRPSAAVA